MSFFTAGRALAPVVGPIVGGYVAEDLGWRWVFWLLTIFSGVISICAIPILKETYEPYLLQRKAAKLRNSTGNDLLQPKASKKASARMVFWRAITRPSKMFFLSPVIFGLSVYIGVVFGYSYLLFATFAEIFQQQYAFSEGEVGLVYLGLFIGMMVALGLTSIVSDRVYAKYTKKHERPKPE
ncbi:MAG: hypothetical protein LQ342_006577 [Letrouitia transgressa]|nr:MAG: hypothetical protein LQ342_006577 [Letrouitia transgressa]